MNNKRGFLLAEETLKIVISVICIGILIYFLTSLYFAKINDEKTKQATETIEQISLSLQGLGEPITLFAIEPIKWELMSFVGEEEKPNSCFGKDCVCICDGVVDVFGRQIKECDKDGACLSVLNLIKFNSIKITKLDKGLTNIKIEKIENKIKITKVE